MHSADMQAGPGKVALYSHTHTHSNPSQTDRKKGISKGNKNNVTQDLTDFPFKPL